MAELRKHTPNLHSCLSVAERSVVRRRWREVPKHVDRYCQQRLRVLQAGEQHRCCVGDIDALWGIDGFGRRD